MNINELTTFCGEFEKNASVGKVLKSLFMAKKKLPLGKRLRTAGKSLLGTGLIVGGLGVGGLAYGAVSQPGSIRNKAPSRFKY